MELYIKGISASVDVTSASYAAGKILFTRTTNTEDAHSITLVAVKDRPGQPSDLVSEAGWYKVDTHQLGRKSLLDPPAKHVISTLQDEKRLVVFSTALSDEPSAACVTVDPKFDTCIKHIVQLFTDDVKESPQHLAAAVSSSGEVVLVAVDANSNIRHHVLPPLALDAVLSCTTFRDDHLVVFGAKDQALSLCIVRFDPSAPMKRLLRPHVSELITLPSPSRSNLSMHDLSSWSVLGSSISEHCAFLLFSDGTVNTHTPDRPSPDGTLTTWSKLGSANNEGSQQPIMVQHFSLLPYPSNRRDTAATARPPTPPKGGIATLSDGYILLGYGRVISVWDDRFFSGHSFTTTGAPMVQLQQTMGDRTRALVLTTQTQGLLEVNDGSFPGMLQPMTLARAVKRRTSCDVFVDDLTVFSDIAPLRAHPLAVKPIRAAAEAAGGDATHIFMREIEAASASELDGVRSALDREATQTPEELWELFRDYIAEDGTLKRGRSTQMAHLRLAHLPSDRVAASCVARCLCEIWHGNMRFLVPLVDMLGSGVVSEDGVLAAVDVQLQLFGGQDPGGDGGPEMDSSSVVNSLARGGQMCCNAVEAVVTQVDDVTAAEIVRAMLFAADLCRENWDDMSGTNPTEWTDIEKQRRITWAKGQRLFQRCVTAAVDSGKVVRYVEDIMLGSALMLLDELEWMLRALRTGCVELNEGLALEAELVEQACKRLPGAESFDRDLLHAYRGVGQWMDRVGVSRSLTRWDCAEGCVEWMCLIVDAHLAGLVLDDVGRETTSRLYDLIHEERRGCAALRSLRGLTAHISRRNVVSSTDPMHKTRETAMPTFAALL